MSPELRERLTRATVKRKPVRYVPLTKKEVRQHIPANQRPARAGKKGKPKRVSNATLTQELNAMERKLNSQGFTLRDNRTVVYHEHQPARAKLEKQVRQVRSVVQVKPKRAPMTGKQLRAKIRSSAKPPRHRSVGAGAATNGYWAQQGPAPSAATDFVWTPTLGESEIGSAYLEARANFSGSIGGMQPGLRGNIVVRAGAYIFNSRLDAFRVDATMTSSLDGSYEAEVKATLANMYEYPIYSKKGAEKIDAGKALDLFDYDRVFHTQLPIVGYPVDIDLTVTPTISVDFEASLNEAAVFGSLLPEVRLEATIDAYIDAMLAEAGAGGSAVLLSASPELSGAVYLSEDAGQTSVESYVSGWVRVRFLEGRVYAFLDLGWAPFSKRFEWELLDYDGWAYDYPVFKWNDSGTP